MNEIHPSMRGYFAHYLLEEAKKDKSIIVVTADLGYGMWDKFRDELPEQFYNVGAAEQVAAGICVGLALEKMKPFFYSITTFGLCRPFETWRNYVNHEKIPVRMCFSGRDKDYEHDGFSHWSEDVKGLFSTFMGRHDAIFSNIDSYWPDAKEEIPDLVEKMVKLDKPQFISLRR